MWGDYIVVVGCVPVGLTSGWACIIVRKVRMAERGD